MSYVDGFVIVVPKKNIGDYRKMAEEGKAMWVRHGALDYKECVSEDMSSHGEGEWKSLPFLQLTNAGPDDAIVFSYILFSSRAHRDEVNAKVMQEMSEKYKDNQMSMPFEMKKMAYGGFEVIVE